LIAEIDNAGAERQPVLGDWGVVLVYDVSQGEGRAQPKVIKSGASNG
jgi:hypothetical protein